jgi:hypothetical protein
MLITFLPRFPSGAKSNTLAPTLRRRLYTVPREQRQRTATSAMDKKSCLVGCSPIFSDNFVGSEPLRLLEPISRATGHTNTGSRYFLSSFASRAWSRRTRYPDGILKQARTSVRT